jgi:DegV family protein with EDD domain
MSSIAVVTDSTATLPQELLQRYNIHVVPLHIMWDRVRYRDGIDIKPEEFYQRLRKSTTLPTTSGAVQGEFLQIFEGLRGKVDGIVCILVSSDLSGAYSSAINAQKLFSEIPVEVIDSRLSTMAMGFGVIAAARMAAEGGTIKQVAQSAKDILVKAHLFFALDTLDYLRRGGRINFSAAVLANLLKVKPVLTLKDGKVEPAARPRTMPKALETLLRLMKEKVTDTPLHAAVMHADNPEAVGYLKKEISERFQCAELLVTGFTPVMGAHTGPGIVGIAFYNE